MKKLSIALVAGAVVLGACSADDGGDSESANDADTTTASSAETTTAETTTTPDDTSTDDDSADESTSDDTVDDDSTSTTAAADGEDAPSGTAGSVDMTSQVLDFYGVDPDDTEVRDCLANEGINLENPDQDQFGLGLLRCIPDQLVDQMISQGATPEGIDEEQFRCFLTASFSVVGELDGDNAQEMLNASEMPPEVQELVVDRIDDECDLTDEEKDLLINGQE